MAEERYRWRAGTAPLVPRPDPVATERRVAGLLLAATGATMFGVYLGSWQEAGGWSDPAAWADALLFSVTLLGILGAHELGHWLVARHLDVHLSLPWFLPFPLWTGTLGAIMRLRQEPRDRTSLLAMAAAGPLAGLTAIVLVLVLRMAFGGESAGVPLARPLLWWALGVVLPGPTPSLTTGDPVGFAAWIGCLVTSMNLLPVGQLDGGHVVGALWPEQSWRVTWIALAALVLAGGLWAGWTAWAVLLLALRTHRQLHLAGPAPDSAALGLAAACAVAWVLCITPVPF